MIVFERHASSQSTSTAERTVNPVVRELLRGRLPETGVVGVIAATGRPLIQTFYRRGFRRRAGNQPSCKVDRDLPAKPHSGLIISFSVIACAAVDNRNPRLS